MIFVLLLAASAAASPAAAASPVTAARPPATPSVVEEAARAIDGGRIDQARLMIGQAIGGGASGAPVDRLLADLAFASGNFEEALGRYKTLAGAARDGRLCLNAATAALKIGRLADASRYAECATGKPNPSWSAWNVRAIAADLAGEWQTADESYARARVLSPANAMLINNQGWSLLLRGDWGRALPLFERAASLNPHSSRIADNLELARAALAADLPVRRPGESEAEWAARLNDAGVAAQLLGDKQRALAAFSQALEASPIWYVRASNNLEAVEAK